MPRTLIVPARPLCLLCGHAMNIAESNRADIGLICFERQKLECPNCGGHDFRFAFLPEKAFSPSAILPASIVAEVQQSSSKPQVAEEVLQPKEIETDPTNSDGPTLADNRAEQPPPQLQFAASQPLEFASRESPVWRAAVAGVCGVEVFRVADRKAARCLTCKKYLRSYSELHGQMARALKAHLN